MPATMPTTPAVTPSAAPGNVAGGPLTPVRADESAARDFAAILGTMLPAQPAAAPVKKVALEAIADAVTDAPVATGTVGDPTADDVVHAHGVNSARPLSDKVVKEGTEPVASATARGSRASRNGRPMRPTEAAVERRRAIAAANAAARTLMGEAFANTAAMLNGTEAAARAAGAAPSRAVAPSGEVIMSTDALDQDFSARLDRVIDRMAQAGHSVEVRETVRTPERQAALYAQGRTATGPVVTWTLDSRHLEGKAADVVVDGRTSGAGYDLLHAIASEEGLRTLGAKDPGHLELPRTTADAREGAAARRGGDGFAAPAGADAIRATVIRPGGIAQVARVATVAQVAQVAQVGAPGMLTAASTRAREVASDRALGVAAARWRAAGLPAMKAPGASSTARAAVPADGATMLGPDATTQARTARDYVGASVPTGDAHDGSAADPTASRNAQGATNGVAAANDDGRGIVPRGPRATEADRDTVAREAEAVRGSRRSLQGAGPLAHEGTPRMAGDALREMPMTHGTRHSAAPITPAGSLAAERVAELLAARDAQPAGTIGELRLAMDPSRDGLNEVRLALQNGALDASLRTSDAGVARGLAAEVSTLTRSLERQGFEGARVAVHLEQAQQARASALDTVAAAEATARERALRGDSDASREGRDQHAPQHSAHDAQRDQQHARQFASRRPRSL